MASCTNRRLVEPQDWPCRPKFMPATAAAATLSTGASGKTMNGFLPPSSSEIDFTATSAAERWMAMPGAHGADEGQALHARMAHDRVAGGAVAGDDVQHARRQHFAGDLAQAHRRQRALVGWLQHHRVARDQRRGHAVDRHGDRMVEGDDAADHAIGLAHGQVQLVRSCREWCGPAARSPGPRSSAAVRRSSPGPASCR